jgi:NADPH:quinone reductase-like Zn-dependent oxidoreductase
MARRKRQPTCLVSPPRRVPRVHRSTVLDAPVEQVWGLLRDFNSHVLWHPAVAESAIEGGRAADEVGCVRRFRLADGALLREQLLRLSDRDRTFSYAILDASIPLIDYVATVTLRPVTDGRRTFWDWRSSFRTPPGQEAALARLVAEEVYDAGFRGARSFLAGTAVRPAARSQATPGVAGPVRGAAVVLARHGGPEALVPGRAEAPPPGEGQVRLRQTAIGVNYLDVHVRSGRFPLLEPPGVPGVEAAGVVLDAGPGVTGLLPGDRVAYACLPPGAYAEVRTLAADRVIALPPHVDDETAAAVLLKGMTAEYLLRRVHRVRRGDVVLVQAAAGGVGLLLCQWAAHLGATVLGTVGSADKARLARDNGCHHPILYREDDLVARVRALTGGRGADVVYDGIGGETLLRSLEALALRGHLVSFGEAAEPPPPIDLGRLTARSATLSSPVVFHYTADPAEQRGMARNLFRMLEAGVLRVTVGQRFPLASAAEAHRALEARRTSGSTVLIP